MESARKIYFNAGPTLIEKEILKKAQSELLDYHGSGISILETSHRSETYKEINSNAQKSLRKLLSIPDDYEVLFLQGGATGHFSAVPLNLAPGKSSKTDYVVTGAWSRKACIEAKNFSTVNQVLPGGECSVGIPDPGSWTKSEDAKYLYYCDNETIDGVEFTFVPESPDIPIVCDVSSNILTRPIDVSKFGVLFASAQKNLGCAGVTVVIVKKSLMGNARGDCPTVLNWKPNADAASMLNTPPTFSIYVLSLVLDWVLKNGGVEEMEKKSLIKSSTIHKIIDESDNFYWSPIDKQFRSRINVTFRVGGKNGDSEVEKLFLAKAKERGFIGLQGHRSVGGIRISLYNAITVEDTEKLASFMTDFLNDHKNTK